MGPMDRYTGDSPSGLAEHPLWSDGGSEPDGSSGLPRLRPATAGCPASSGYPRPGWCQAHDEIRILHRARGKGQGARHESGLGPRVCPPAASRPQMIQRHPGPLCAQDMRGLRQAVQQSRNHSQYQQPDGMLYPQWCAERRAKTRWRGQTARAAASPSPNRCGSGRSLAGLHFRCHPVLLRHGPATCRPWRRAYAQPGPAG